MITSKSICGLCKPHKKWKKNDEKKNDLLFKLIADIFKNYINENPRVTKEFFEKFSLNICFTWVRLG